MGGNDKEFPIFNGKNYDSWSIRMRAYFMSQDLWDSVEGDSSKGEGSNGVEAKEMRMKDGKALSIILEAIPESVVPCLAGAMTSKEAWTILNEKYGGSMSCRCYDLFPLLLSVLPCILAPPSLEESGIRFAVEKDIDASKENVTGGSVSQPSDNQNMEEMGGSTEAAEEMESSPASEYHVFLSFRGEDTRNGFTSHLYDDLVGRGISTFIDSEKLEKGEKIDRLFEYIEKSKIIVVIFSERYAESRWCLKEVVRSVECKKQIIPVFFGVEPSDVRKQSGPFESAFRKHDKKQKQEDVRKWREALEEVGYLSGFTLKDGKEAELRREIVKLLSTKASGKTLEVAKHPIGLETRVEDVKKIIGKCSHQVHMIGIHGMGGLGKTTIAKAVYNDLAKEIDSAACFLSDSREKSRNPNIGLVTLQKQVLQEIFKDGNICFNDVALGKNLIKERAKNKRVLLVLDDVDSVEQIDGLAGERDWFGSGSVIIITTRDKGVLLTHRVKEEEIYKPQMLNEAQSLELFCRHAFDGVQSQAEYVQLAGQVVAAACGLPLTIKVLGSLLSSINDVGGWRDILEKVKKIPHKEVQQTLKISYESLSDYEKEIFLDISHFFVGRGRRNAIYMWEGLGWHPKPAIRELERKSLISINEKSGEFEMHDQIRDMGREIVGGESSKGRDEKHTRFRAPDSLDLLRPEIVGRKDVEAIQVIGGWDDPTLVDIGFFADMSRLRMLQLDNVKMNGEYERFPRNMRWLQCRLRELACLPSCLLHLENMVVLDLSRSSIVRLWDGQKVFRRLKVLNLSDCRSLVVCPDFTDLPHLEILDFRNCRRMNELDPSIGHLKSLIELCLAHCESLKELPEEIYKLTSLQKLDLSDCAKIIALPRQSGDSKSSEQHVLGKLQVLLLRECHELTGCPDFIKMPNLETLSFQDCEKMTEIDPSIGHLKSLIRLNLSRCSSLEELPREIGRSTSLEELDLSYCSQISSLPGSMGRLKQLNSLNLTDCHKISSLPESMGRLKQLKSLSLRNCSSLQEIPKSIVSLHQLETLEISDCELLKSLPPLPPSLIRLDADGCCQLESVGDISNVKGLQELDLSRCESLLDVAGIEHLKFLELLKLGGCRSLRDSILEGIQDLEKLKKLDLGYCESLTKSPHFTSNMTDLQELDLSGLVNMTEVDPSIRHLKALTRLSMENCRSLNKVPEEVCQLTSLEHLGLTDCCQITALPESIGRLKQLRWLDVGNCSSLREVPESICSLLHLEWLNASGCKCLASLPNSLGNLKRLPELHLSWTAIEHLPDSIIQLENLEHLSVESCHDLRFLPRLPPSVTALKASCCIRLLDIRGIEQLSGLRRLFLGGCIRLEDSLLERVESALLKNSGLEYFCIPGRLIEGGSSYPQSLSFPLPRHFKNTVLYLYVDESSLNSIKTEIENRSEQEEERMGSVVRLACSIDDIQFLFSASFRCKYHEHTVASFKYEEMMKKVAEADVQRMEVMRMRVSIDGCNLLHGAFFSLEPHEISNFESQISKLGHNNVVEVLFY
ncbi:unnamed protein product [Victoria cruziana]